MASNLQLLRKPYGVSLSTRLHVCVRFLCRFCSVSPCALRNFDYLRPLCQIQFGLQSVYTRTARDVALSRANCRFFARNRIHDHCRQHAARSQQSVIVAEHAVDKQSGQESANKGGQVLNTVALNARQLDSRCCGGADTHKKNAVFISCERVFRKWSVY